MFRVKCRHSLKVFIDNCVKNVVNEYANSKAEVIGAYLNINVDDDTQTEAKRLGKSMEAPAYGFLCLEIQYTQEPADSKVISLHGWGLCPWRNPIHPQEPRIWGRFTLRICTQEDYMPLNDNMRLRLFNVSFNICIFSLIFIRARFQFNILILCFL